MATGDGGLQNITLQDGYRKLMVSDSVSGIADNITQVSTSTGTALAPSTLYMGKNEQSNIITKQVAQAWNNNFFAIQASVGSNILNVETPLLECFSGAGSINNNSVSKFSEIVCINTAASTSATQTDMSTGQIVFGQLSTGATLDNDSKTFGGPTIFVSPSNGNVVFRQNGNDPSTEWQMDRLLINDTGIGTTTPILDASAALTTLGEVAASGLIESTGGFIANGSDNIGFNSTDNLNLTASDDVNIINSKIVNILAKDDAGSAVVNIDAVSIDSVNFTPTINIGTKSGDQLVDWSWDASGNSWVSTNQDVDGTENINIGARASNNDSNLTQLNINNAYTTFANLSLVKYNQWDSSAAETSALGGPLDSSSWNTNEVGTYYIYDSSAGTVTFKWYDARNDKHKEVVSYDYADGVNSRHTAVTVDPGNGTVGETSKYIWKNGSNEHYDIISFQYDAATRYIKYMRIDDTTASPVYAHATSLP